MTRPTPVVKRRIRNPGNFARAVAIAQPLELTQVPRWMEDAKLFATGWVAGLIVFGTFLA